MNVMRAIPITAGTNIPDTLSAIFATGAFVAAASLTILMMADSVVSSPTLVASQTIYPEVFIVAADTGSPTAFSTGTLSPVRADSFTALAPSFTYPSTGMLSPGRTAKRSPTFTVSMGTVTSVPSFIITAVFGESFIRLFKASVVFPFDLASKSLPTVIKVSIMAAASK